ncbi:hypothetical protein D3C74_369540 [compost metagenome]
MNTIPACWRPNIIHRVTYTFSYTALDLVMINQTHTHGVNQRITFIALIKHHFATNGRNTDTVTVSSNTRYNMFEQIFNTITL